MTEEWSSKCGWSDDQQHMYVEPGTAGWKEHPFVQYAAELFELVRMCHKCGTLTREGRAPNGTKREWFSESDKRQHWRTCVSGVRVGMSGVQEGMGGIGGK